MKRIASEALLVRKVAYGESDLIVALLTRTDGQLSALVRGGRKSARRVGGALEPFHTILVHVEDRGGDLGTLKEARVVRARERLVHDLPAMEAAGAAMRWARQLWPPRHPEPAAWATLTSLLDALDATEGAPRALLAMAGLRLLADVGYGLDLDRCVRCGRPCPEGRAAQFDAAKGGIVCSACGEGRRILGPELLAAMRKVQKGERPVLTREQAEELLGIVADAMAAHAGVQPSH